MTQTERMLDGRQFVAPGGLKETSTRKYRAGEVIRNGRSYFLKEVLSPDNANSREDLRNEVRWFVNVGTIVAKERQTPSFTVPEVIDVSPAFDWALYEHVDASALPEETLEQELPGMADIAVYLFSAPFPRQDTSLATWYKNRLERLSHVYDTLFFSDFDHQRIDDLLADPSSFTVLKPGLVHRDINPSKNVLLKPDGTKVLIDAELGTTPDKPEWDKPRFDDIAYMYHLFHCQYQDPRLADQFLANTLSKLERSPNFDGGTLTQEFYLSLLERTLSMMSHFVIAPKSDRAIDDRRRTASHPYVALIRESLAALARV